MGQIDFKALFEEFNQKKVLIIGDVMVDTYLHGNVDRISPEAPVPVIHVRKKELKSGGAANVALNVVGLGAKAYMFSVVGEDDNGDSLMQLLENKQVDCNGIIRNNNRPTTVKTRIISQGQQILRVDQEEVKPITEVSEQLLLNRVSNVIADMDVVIIEDYNKGLLTPGLISGLIKLCNEHNVPVTVDPKKDNFFAYTGVTLFKPNRKEIIEGLKLDGNLKAEGDVKSAISQLHDKLNADSIMVTLSEDGVVISDSGDFTFIPAHRRRIYDVSGAGDTVISVASLCLTADIPKSAIAAISNIAGGLVCEQPGVVQVDKNQLLEEVEKLLSE